MIRVTDLRSFIEKSNIVHSNKYDYSKSLYTKSSEKIEIICSTHGSFWQIARDHYNSKAGCSACSGTKRLTNKTFLAKANKVHKNKFTYPELNYKNNREKIKIECSVHGVFFQTPTDHLSGKSCPLCSKLTRAKSKTLTQINFIKRCTSIHGDKYDYSKTVYSRMNDEIIVICKTHGEFNQRANDHQRGVDCLKCAQMVNHYNRSSFIEFCRKNSVGVIYLINCFNDGESFFKVGITSKINVSKRFNSNYSMPYKYNIVGTVFGSAKNIWDMEKFIHRDLAKSRYKPDIHFNGMTECFSELNDKVLSFFGVSHA